MTTKWRITIGTPAFPSYAEDVATSEEEARQQASGWTGQRGQMTWTAVIFTPDGKEFATYKRGQEVES